MHSYDYDIEEASGFKRLYKKFDRLNPFLVGFLSYMALSLIYTVLPFGMNDVKYDEVPALSEALPLLTVLTIMTVFPPLMFFKGAIQNRAMPLCLVALMITLFLSLINIARIIRILEAVTGMNINIS